MCTYLCACSSVLINGKCKGVHYLPSYTDLYIKIIQQVRWNWNRLPKFLLNIKMFISISRNTDLKFSLYDSVPYYSFTHLKEVMF
jgi:hypothetical protein